MADTINTQTPAPATSTPDLKLQPGEDFAAYETRVSAAQGVKNPAPAPIPATPAAPVPTAIPNPVVAPNTIATGTPTPTLPSPTAPTATASHLVGIQTSVDQARTTVDTQQQAQVDAANKALDDAKAAKDKATASLTADQVEEQKLTAPWQADYEKAQEDVLHVNENFEANQKLTDELDTLLQQGNDLIAQQKGQSIATDIISKQTTKTLSDISARAGVIQAVMVARNSQISVAENLIDRAVAATTADKKDQLDYYTALDQFYGKQVDDAGKKIDTISADKKAYIAAQIKSAQDILDNAQKNADYIKGLMEDPTTALSVAQAGVTLNDSPDQVNTKLAAQSYLDQKNKTISDFASKGYSYMATTAQANTHPKDQLYTIKDAKGNDMTFWLDPKKSTSGVTTAEQLQADIASAGSALQSVVGPPNEQGDRYVNPKDYARLKAQWKIDHPSTTSGKLFDTTFAIYRDPNDPVGYDVDS